MKKIVLVAAVLVPMFLFAQKKGKDVEEVKYRRSSLHIMMMEDDKLPEREIIVGAFKNAPFPNKYNDHNIGVVRAPYIQIEEGTEAKKEEGDEQGKNKLKGGDKVIEAFFDKQKIANKLVAKWFNQTSKGDFNMELIADRGQYDATDLDVKKAGGQARSVNSQLIDAGFELIDKTFVVINKFNFFENEIPAKIAHVISLELVNEMKADNPLMVKIKQAAKQKADDLYERMRKGYTVTTKAFLYKLDWSDAVSTVFYNDYWVDENTPEEEKQKRFDLFKNSDLFQLNFVGMDKARILILNLKGGDLTKQQIIAEATTRSIDRVYAKLQKGYDVFKAKTPLLTYDKKNCSAKIGMKEGLEGKEKFEVLEQGVNKEGLTVYKKILTIQVDPERVWDNRFKVTDAPTIGGDDVVIQATYFNKCKTKKLYPGILIRQLK